MKTINNLTKALMFALIVGVFQQLSAQKVIVQEWDFETNTQSNNGLEFGWPTSSPGTVSGGTFTVDGASASSNYVNFDDVNSGKLTYSISLNSWELSDVDGTYWELRFYDSGNGELARYRITTQNKTTYIATSVYAMYKESGVWTNSGGIYKVGRINPWYTNTGDSDNGNSGAFGHSLPFTMNFTLDLDADTYTIWAGENNSAEDDGSLWTIWGGANAVNTGDAALGAGVSHLKWNWVRAAGASNINDVFLEIDKISIYTGEVNTISSITDGAWSDASTWSSTHVPFATDIVTVDHEVTINGDITVNDVTVSGSGSLTVDSDAVLTNNGTITNNGTVTFESDDTGSAYIGESSGTFTGDFVVERYIPARRAFRLLSTPVTTDDYISDNWQQATDITGSVGGSNGFDASVMGNPSMFTMDNSDASWDAISNTDATILSAGTPYRIMVRGDRSIDLTNNAATPTATTLSATGTLTAESAAPSALTLNENLNGYSFVGNPFQAPVNMNTILSAATNLNTTYYWAWDATLGDRGAYVTITAATGATNVTSDANQYLQAGQAAFVQTASAAAASLTFTQASKYTAGDETAVFKTSGKSSKASKLSLNLYESNALAENNTASDGILLFFDENYSNSVDAFDAAKFTNLDENFAISNGGSLLSIEQRATPTLSDAISLEITKYRNTEYTIVAEGSSLIGETAFLYDVYTNEYTEIPQNGTATYSYSIDADAAASIAADRFSIRFSKALSVSDVELQKIQLFPNPVNNENLFIQVPQNVNDLEVVIYNAMGVQLYMNSSFEAGRKAEINTDFANKKGLYFVKLSSKGSSTTKKLIID